MCQVSCPIDQPYWVNEDDIIAGLDAAPPPAQHVHKRANVGGPVAFPRELQHFHS